jgi:Domain of unknown function (DUF4388)
MSLQGSLQHIQLHDVIQLVSVSGKSGIFHLKKGGQEGKIYLKNGNIIHAELGTMKGEEAVYTLAVWSEGEFYFEPDTESPEETIKKNNTSLLMEAARRMDEWKILSKKIPSFDMIPEFKPQPLSSKAHIHLNTGEWLILSKVTGIKTIEQISAETNMSIFDLCKILYGLITNNLIQLKQASQEQIPSSPQQEIAPREAESPRESIMPSEEHQQKQPGQPPAADATSPPEPSFQELEVPVEVSGHEFDSAHTINEKEKIIMLLNKIKEIAEQILGIQGKAIIIKEFEKAKKEIEMGKGMEALNDAITQIARATTILKGPSTTEMLLEQIKMLKST